MKKILYLIGLLSLTSTVALAADNLGMRNSGYGKAGCGLGSMIFKGRGTGSQILAATTNGTFHSQLFGISTGSSNCTADGAVKAEAEKQVFVAANYDTLNQEMAKGEGESVATLAHLMGCPQSATGDFAKATQANYGKLSQAIDPNGLIVQVEQLVANDANLNKVCR